jgi:hypothetical protein
LRSALLFLLCSACAIEPGDVSDMSNEQLAKDLKAIRNARVFFGHHSVGQDVLDGLRILSHEVGVDLTIDDAPIGENKQPLGKMEAFAERARGADLALMKLCYVDFDPHTDVDGLLAKYRETVERIRDSSPNTRLLHVTTPLTTRQSDIKSRINRTIGRLVWEDQANKKRLAYNDGIRALFAEDPIFDLADVESTRPDGEREQYDVDGKPVPMLWPGFSRDHGHLNENGKRVAARAFARAVASALEEE